MPGYKDPQQSLARLLFCHLFYFLPKETISNDLLIGIVKVSLKEHTTWSSEKAATTECYE